MYRIEGPLRIVAITVAAAVFVAAAADVAMGVVEAGNPGIRTMAKIEPIKQSPGQSGQARQAWAHQYGQDASQMPNLPDVAAATPDQVAAATDLLTRTEAGTAGYADPAAAQAAGYDIPAALARAEQKRPGIAKQMQRADAGRMETKMVMLHVPNVSHRSNAVLDPSAPQDLMFAYQGHNTWKLVGVMYTANGAYPGAPPDPGGPITRWHYHDIDGGRSLMMHVFFGNDLAHAYAMHMESM